MKTARVIALLILLPLAAMAQTQAPAAPSRGTIPEISGAGGKCTVDFRVTDPKGHGIYDAKIHATIRYGFATQRKLDLEAGTNADGRARFVKLGEELKPVTFSISYGTAKASQLWAPNMDCFASYDIVLRTDEVSKGRTVKAAPGATTNASAAPAAVAPAVATAPATPTPAAPAAKPATPSAPAAPGRPAASAPAATPSAVKPAATKGGKVTDVNADMGGNCTVDFRVTDMKGDGLYDAKISTSIRYGFMSQRKLDLEAGTNADGRARFTKLSAELKTVTFTITNGVDRARRIWAPNMDCYAQYTVPLKTK